LFFILLCKLFIHILYSLVFKRYLCAIYIMPAKMPTNYSSEMEGIDNHDGMTESGYVSAGSGSSEDYVPEIVFTKPHLQFLNRQLQFLEPQGPY
jgi:hypothetical protein